MFGIFATRSFLPFFLALSIIICLGQAFFIPSTTSCLPRLRHNEQVISTYSSPSRKSHSVALAAKKKRRRRKTDSTTSSSSNEQESSESSVPQPGPGDTDELPDFDLEGEEVEPRKKIKRDEITANMMGSGNTAEKSLDELISDRALESKFEFDEKEDPSIPDFVDLAQASSTTPSSSYGSDIPGGGTGKKKQRQAERVANAIAAKEAEKPVESFLESVPQFLNEKGDVSAIKILEQGGKLFKLNRV